jgi:hypothetical protein
MKFGGAMPAGSSRMLRLDPFTLPVRFSAEDAEADERVRVVELHRSRVLLRRAVRGMRMVLNLPLAAYRGVALRMREPSAADAGGIAIMLEHDDPALSVPLSLADDGEEVVADWQSWARVLEMPLLVADADGTLREPIPRLGKLRVAPPMPRRRRIGALRRRRPSILLRRRPGAMPPHPNVHRDEREIIART